MFRSSFHKVLFAVLAAVLFILPVTGISSAAAQSSDDAGEAFQDLLKELNDDGVVRSLDGKTTSYGDYTDEWAQLGWYQWITFEHTNRFVFSANVSWNSASATPNTFDSGCGILFNAASGNTDHILASIRMDGFIYINGFRNRSPLSYGTYRYGPHSVKGSADFVLVVDNDKAWVYVDGQRVVSKAGLVIMGDGVGISTLSGTNKDYGTRCTWKDIYFYSW